MAFVSATPLLVANSIFTQGASSARLTRNNPPPQAPPPPVTTKCVFEDFVQRRREASRARKHDFRTAAEQQDFATDRADHDALVIGVRSVCPKNHHWELTLSAIDEPIASRHTAPGQFVQIAVGSGKNRKLAYYTISSPPGGLRDGSIQVLFSSSADPLGLRRLKSKSFVDISVPLGAGIDHSIATGGGSASDIYIFTDSVQGYAVAKSLVEWDLFRALSGEGANRRNHVNLLYSLPSGGSLPYAERLSSWACFAVNVVPLAGLSIMEHMSAPTALGRPRHSPAMDHAFACVASDDTFEALFCSLVLLGFRRNAIHRHTQETVAKQARTAAPNWGEDEFYQTRQRERVEDEVWRRWVAVRESMRKEFERKWAMQNRMESKNAADERAKKQAWASWFMHNTNQWDQVEWDNQQWGQYWSSWSAPDSSSSNNSWASGKSSSSSSSSGYAWTQQNSQEYWDWVKRGTEPKSNSNSNAGSSGAWDYYAGSGGSWGSDSSSGYQKGGYKYTYEDSEADKKEKRWGGAGAGSGSSGAGAGKKNPWGKWSYRSSSESHKQQQRSWGGYGGRSRGNSSGSQVFGDMDFYAVLGISSSASRADIKKAYRKKAMQHHPDRNPDRQEEAHAKMKQIVVAWSVLKDSSKRERYDKYGSSGL